MPAICPNEGETTLLAELLGAGEDWSLGLITTDVTPAETDVAATWTAAEASGSWYARKTLTRSVSGTTWSTPASAAPSGSWSAEAAVAAAQYNAASPQSWTYSGAGATIYGYFYIGATSGKLIFAEKFATAQPVVEGNVVNFTPQFALA